MHCRGIRCEDASKSDELCVKLVSMGVFFNFNFEGFLELIIGELPVLAFTVGSRSRLQQGSGKPYYLNPTLKREAAMRLDAIYKMNRALL
ncbi:hypothetical protein V6N11_079815 [Hibiscus sabdariffa]|uniref:Uncharacterized protein n=1 Tax=Hibiscus sabdariffa TaxID=183260 RepID=A0ABR2RWH9_9ROSI